MISGFLFILGISIGSFLNVLIDRLPEGRWPSGRSACDYCNRALGPFELVPVFSWLIQKGKSICCKKSLSAQYPVIELATGFLYVLVGHYVVTAGLIDILESMTWLRAGALFVMMTMLLGIVGADIKFHIIPDVMTVVFTAASLVYIWPTDIAHHILAGFVLMGGMYLLHVLTKGKGMGLGDVKFAGAMGLLLGLQNGFLAIYLAFLLGGVVGTILLLGKSRGLKSMIAFGPFLVAGTVIMLLWSEKVWEIIYRFI